MKTAQGKPSGKVTTYAEHTSIAELTRIEDTPFTQHMNTEWQNRPLDEIYPILYLDATIVKVRSEGRVINKSAYLAVGITLSATKDVLGIWLEQTEGA